MRIGGARDTDLAALTGLRGIAAVTVVAYHYLQARTIVAGAFHSTFAGYLGVDLFFMLSGFLMALNYGPAFDGRWRVGSYADFIGKRAARVYPLYAVVTVVVLVLSHWNVFDAHVGPRVVVLNLALVQQLGPGWLWPRLGDSILGGAWSISTELGAYLLFPALYVLACRGRPSRRLLTFLGGFASILVLVLLPATLKVQQLPSQGPLDLWSGWSAWPLIRCLAGFTIGLGLWRLRSDRLDAAVGSEGWGLAALACVLVGLAVPGADFLAVVAIAALIAHLARARSRLTAAFSSRPMLWLGEVSYAVYLLHVSLIRLTYEHPVGPFASPGFHARYPLVLVATLTILFVSARLLFLHVERPARQWMRALLSLPMRGITPAEPAAP